MTDHNDLFIWHGRIDHEEAYQDALRLHQLMQPLDAHQGHQPAQQQGIAIVGFCCDEGVQRNQGRVGAAAAPNVIRSAMANLPWQPHRPVYDADNIHCIDGDLDGAHQQLAERVALCLGQQHLPVVLGGGHEVAYGSWLGLTQHLAAQGEVPHIGIINFDAHFDLRLASHGASSGTPFYQIHQACEDQGLAFHYCCLGVSELANTQALFKRAKSLQVNYLTDTEMAITALPNTLAQLEQFMAQCDVIYLTIDLDVLPAGVAPGVSAPAARGVGLEVLEPLIAHIKASGKLALADIAEYNPLFDIDGRTAKVAARLFYDITI